MVFKVIFVAVLWTILMLLSGTGLLRTNNLNTVAADGVWAEILAALAPGFYAFLLLSFDREDKGFRSRGLPGLMIVGVALTALIAGLGLVLLPVFAAAVTKRRNG